MDLDVMAVVLRQHQTMLLTMHQYLKLRRARRLQKKRRAHRVWIREWIAKRSDHGLYDRLMVELRNEDQRSFKNFMRMPPDMFDEIVQRLTPALLKQTTRLRDPHEPGLKIAVTLRHLASGATYSEMQYGWRMPHNSISVVVREVCEAIVAEYGDELLKPPQTQAEWRTVTDEWMSRWNFPHVIGAMDGKHIAIKAPANSGSDYYNYKGFFSIILLAVVTSDYKFMWIDVSGKGASSDAHIFNASALKDALEKNDLLGFPQPDPLPGDTEDIPYFLVGDDAFALRTFMMKPYGKREMTREERIFNYRLSRARRVVENSFGILANRFQVLLTTMLHEPDTVRLLIKTCVILHNLMRTRYPVMQNRLVDVEERDGNLVPGAWRQGRNLLDTRADRVAGHNRDFKKAKAQRNLIREWCDGSAGSVPWQDRMIQLPR